MASPQRPEFHGVSGRDDPENRGLRPGQPPAGRRATFLFPWLIGVILIGAFFYWIAWGWEGTGGYWWAHQAAPARGNSGRMIKGTGLDALNAANKQPYIDKNFRVSNVPIEKKVTDRIYWIGPAGRPPMLVVVSGNASSANLKQLTAGTLANVAGTIDKAPPAAQAESQWPLSNPGLARLEREGAYVRATEMIWAPK
jgi:hypothetical protein